MKVFTENANSQRNPLITIKLFHSQSWDFWLFLWEKLFEWLIWEKKTFPSMKCVQLFSVNIEIEENKTTIRSFCPWRLTNKAQFSRIDFSLSYFPYSQNTKMFSMSSLSSNSFETNNYKNCLKSKEIERIAQCFYVNLIRQWIIVQVRRQERQSINI